MKLRIISKILLTLLVLGLLASGGMAGIAHPVINLDAQHVDSTHTHISGMLIGKSDYQNGEYSINIRDPDERVFVNCPIDEDDFNGLQMGQMYHYDYFCYPQLNYECYKIHRA